MKTINLQITTGYEVLEKTQTIKMRKALDLLLSGKQSEYLKAINNYNGTATLFYSVIKCPYCSGELPIKHGSNKKISSDRIIQWGSGQMTLLEDENSNLLINESSFANKTNYCPCCKKESEKANRYYDINITEKRGKITISCLLDSIDGLLNTNWSKRIELKAPFIYYETIVFNLHSGHTYVMIANPKGDIVCIRDITENPDFIKNGILYNLILASQKLRKELKRVFKGSAAFTFHSRLITLENLGVATRFVGYNKKFYDSIPFGVGTYKIFPGFKSIAKKLHLAKNIPDLYKQLKLPENKVARRIVFSNPGLMFYHREIKRLYSAVNNVDYFNSILLLDHICFILASINCYPVIGDFIQEAFRYETGSVVMTQIADHFYSLSVYGIRYMSMKDEVRKMERGRKSWLSLRAGDAYGDYSSVLPSLIRFESLSEMPNCKIDGYSFEWLITSSDYQKAGQVMHNYLESTYQPTIVIKSNGTYIAAISFDVLSCNKITQAIMGNNRPVSNSVPLCEAIQKWCKKYDIEWPEHEDEYEYSYEDLPF